MSTVHEGKLTEMQQRIVAIDAEIGRLDGQYSECASRFDIGDEGSMKQAAILEARIDKLRRERQLIGRAQVQIGEKQQQELIQAELDEKRRKLIEAKQHADLAVQANVEIDRALVNLRELFARRAVALHALIATGQCEPIIIGKLLGKPCATRAACHARLQTIISIESTAPTSFAPLASANAMLLGIGSDISRATNVGGTDSTPPPERHVERRLPKNGGG
jgi:hypothetical protein